ncbi:ricin-type beta-trefoil lectin domain protein [Streptomyces sp. NPDC013455]|uniref:RICIN domain-containing protein n=1 Tax=Streptomyces sp. NPDC013455 TaxID=3155605 RepID=UPI0033E15093
MPSPYPPRPPYPPLPGPTGESDHDLVARLSGPDGARHHAVALLLARHWRATRDYAVVCLASAGPTAQLVATAAFHQVLGRMAGGVLGGALRPRLLLAVRDTVRAWAADDAARAMLPELRKTTGARGLRAAKPGPAESRQLAARAFRALPGASQCLLWHAEVEAEPIYIPAGLLGIDTATAMTALEQAREQFRAGCVSAHRELAPSRECRFHNRLLDVPIRRGGVLLPDVRRHLTVCRHCRHFAEQLGHFDGALPLLLAETVLGWGARRYLDSRPGRGARQDWPPPPPEPPAASPAAGGRHRTGPEHRHRRAVAVGVGLASLALLATVLAAASRFDDNGVRAPGATWGAPADSTSRPGGAGPGPTSSPSAASVGRPVEIGRGALRGLASGHCLDVSGGRGAAGSRVRLAPCSAATSQQWSYRDDGSLRSADDPTLCLAADPGTGSVALADCAGPAGEVSYDFTVRGEIVLRRRHGLALAPGSGRSAGRVGLSRRDDSAQQRWSLEPGAADGRSRSGPASAPEPGSRGGHAGRGGRYGRHGQGGPGGGDGKGVVGKDVDGKGGVHVPDVPPAGRPEGPDGPERPEGSERPDGTKRPKGSEGSKRSEGWGGRPHGRGGDAPRAFPAVPPRARATVPPPVVPAPGLRVVPVSGPPVFPVPGTHAVPVPQPRTPLAESPRTPPAVQS